MKKRIYYIDILRIIGIFAVIIIHVSAEGYYHDIGNNFYMNSIMNNLVHCWAVPLFITITGYLLLDKNISYNKIFKHYILKMGLILLIWHYIYYFVYYVHFSIKNLFIVMIRLLTGVTYPHLWYLYLLIGLYILTPYISKFVKSLNKKELLIFILGGFILNSIIPILSKLFGYNFIKFINPYKVLNINSYLLFYMLGYYIKKYNKFYKYNNIKITLLISSILIIFNSCMIIKYSIFTLLNCDLLASLFITSLFIFLSKLKIINNIKNKNILIKLGDLTFGVYLIHFFVEQFLYSRINFYFINPILSIILISILILIISYIFSYIISKIYGLRKIIGL